MTAPFIAIILVNWNGKADTLECLASLESDTYPNKQIIVVDNGSQDDSVHVIRARFPAVTVIETGANLGFTGGNNVGIRHALAYGADYVFLLNNDTTVEPDALTLLVNTAQKNVGTAAITPAIYYHADPTKPWFLGSGINWQDGKFFHHVQPISGASLSEAFEISWANGCAMLIPASRLRELGALDESFFCYCEDVDWSLRAQARGYACLLCPAASIYHKVSSSAGEGSPMQTYYMTRNTLLIIARHARGVHRLRLIGRRTRRALRGIYHLRKNGGVEANLQQARALLDALKDFYRNHLGRRICLQAGEGALIAT